MLTTHERAGLPVLVLKLRGNSVSLDDQHRIEVIRAALAEVLSDERKKGGSHDPI